MQGASSRVSLFLLAPEHEGSPETALYHAGQLAELLNRDDDLPESIRGPASTPEYTAEGVLSFNTRWCLTRKALNFAVLLDGGLLIGNMSLSHIDHEYKRARTGCFMSRRYDGLGYAAYAFAELLRKAWDLGLGEVSGAVPELGVVPPSVWADCRTKLERDGLEVRARRTAKSPPSCAPISTQNSLPSRVRAVKRPLLAGPASFPGHAKGRLAQR